LNLSRQQSAASQFNRSVIVQVADTIIKLLKDDTGATAIEYALIAAAMGLALLTGLPVLKGGVDSLYNRIANSLNNPLVNI
jgi:pilus assembly protein Flp/PilA